MKNKFLQFFQSLSILLPGNLVTQVLAQNVWAHENPKVETSSQASNLGPHDC